MSKKGCAKLFFYLLILVSLIWTGEKCFASDSDIKFYCHTKVNLRGFPLNDAKCYVQALTDGVTILGYQINRGNLKSVEQKKKKEFKEKTLKFGEKMLLYTTDSYRDIIETIIETDSGSYVFSD